MGYAFWPIFLFNLIFKKLNGFWTGMSFKQTILMGNKSRQVPFDCFLDVNTLMTVHACNNPTYLSRSTLPICPHEHPESAERLIRRVYHDSHKHSWQPSWLCPTRSVPAEHTSGLACHRWIVSWPQKCWIPCLGTVDLIIGEDHFISIQCSFDLC